MQILLFCPHATVTKEIDLKLCSYVDQIASKLKAKYFQNITFTQCHLIW